ncbi:MAG TPA: potassium transporter Kup [Steroidobacteraceae bacterium]|jgi:KUP system potassium uptake protein|nr:potassium transporter Kup [Steroidobacteraceae bacterium]
MTSTASPQASRALTIAALGVVFGDIGTSPLYALRQCFAAGNGVPLTRANVLGVLSLILWSLIVVVSIKYVLVMLRVNNRGEGGVLALSALLGNATRNWRLWQPVVAAGMLGAALFFGDGLLTPAISVLSAVEGVVVAQPNLHPFVVPLTVGILVALFIAQSKGTGAVGRVFGPIIIVWFLALGVLGAVHIFAAPSVLLALNPLHALQFFAANGWQGFVTLSAVFLAVTGGEALYADLGHFGRTPISRAWFRLVLPALILNYFGQGALLLGNPAAIQNPFYLLSPSWLLAPLIVLATAATIIASQAVISGVFSVVSQALNLGYLPRLRIVHSSAAAIGQIYVPSVNWVLLAGSVLLVVGFGSSEALAGAYGIAVSATMLLAGILILVLGYIRQREHRFATLALLVAISLVDLAFFCANTLRVFEGGWIPLVLGLAVYTLMATWREGRRLLNWNIAREQSSTAEFLKGLEHDPPHRVAGTAVYLTSEATVIPRSLVQQVRLQRSLHERSIILTFVRTEVPRLTRDERVAVDTVAPGIYRVIAHYGFMEQPDAVAALRLAEEQGLTFEAGRTVYIVGRNTPIVTGRRTMAMWRKRLFALMARNSQLAYRYFGVPTHRLLEVGGQTEL